jgi:hypothetical protein
MTEVSADPQCKGRSRRVGEHVRPFVPEPLVRLGFGQAIGRRDEASEEILRRPTLGLERSFALGRQQSDPISTSNTISTRHDECIARGATAGQGLRRGLCRRGDEAAPTARQLDTVAASNNDTAGFARSGASFD